MRRLNLSTKLLVAALPLIVAVVTLLALSVRNDLADIDAAEHGAELGGVWQPLIDALGAIENEADPANATDDTARTATNLSVNTLRDSITVIGASEAAGDHVTSARSALSAARRNLDMATVAPDLQTEIDPADAYAEAGREIVAIGQLLPAEAGDADLGRELLAVVKLAEAKLTADQIHHGVEKWQSDPSDLGAITNARAEFGVLQTLFGEFEAIAPEEWASQFRQAGFSTSLAGFRSQLDQAARASDTGSSVTFDTAGFEAMVDSIVDYQTSVSNEIVGRANAEAEATSSATIQRIGVILAIVLVALLLAWVISRSITKRIKAVARGANLVTTEQLPALVEALRDPRGKGVLPEIDPISTRGSDELSELATSFNAMQDTLVDVAQEQVEVLRRGVSDIFVTMARRNRSLIDRQLAMLDEFEAEVDDPEVLSNYYQLDHMATRMRRNSESLLVLANAEPKRRRVRATEVDDVVRAAIGEVEDYRRIEIEALESLQVRGNVVADVSHLLAELLDNATSFSPPDSHVRVGGRMGDEGYMIRIVDTGVGIGGERLKELNELLREPPVVGLSVESTLGMSVVSLLANKHAIKVTLSSGNPGLIVDVVLPPALFGPIDAEHPSVAPGVAANAAAVAADHLSPSEPIEEPAIVEWDDTIDEDRPVAQGDLRAMSANLAAFQIGMRSALPVEPEEVGVEEVEVEVEELDAEQVEVDEIEAIEVAAEIIELEEIEDIEVAAELDGVEVEDIDAEIIELDEIEDIEDIEVAAELEIEDIEDIEVAADAVDDVDEPLLPVAASDDSSPVEAPADDPVVLVALDALDAPALTEAEPAPVAAAFGAPTLPPPASPRAEFAVPPAPPLTASGPSLRPVTPDNARTVPRPASPESFPSLPTRSPGQGPDGGPDRLASALDAALPTRSPGGPGPDGGPDRLAGGAPTPLDAPDGSLPTRARVGDPLDPLEEPPATKQSTSDPDALRDRLRAFQAEFRSALGTDAMDRRDDGAAEDRDGIADLDTRNDHNDRNGHDQYDLGGDRR